MRLLKPLSKIIIIALRFAVRWPAAQGKDPLLSVPSIYEPAQARKRLCWLNMLGYSIPPLRGWCDLDPTVAAPIFIFFGLIDPTRQERLLIISPVK